MQILYLKSIDSTQKYLKELVHLKKIKLPYAVIADIQTSGVGSRENTWESISGNLFLSFAISLEELPKDLRLESASIYFAYILKQTLEKFGSKVWLKWPNDFYIDDKKIGGMITNLVDECLICGVGLNLVSNPNGFEKLDIVLNKDDLISQYFKNIEKKPQWKQVFSKYELEFYKSKNFYTHRHDVKVSLKDVKLQYDGSIVSCGERIYSRR
ncbi:MAG: biotin--[acetyl-CoA-carboxylase] ligase [Epsilonproteobacteria bacterium]|nr:biotin--[acetyl-CoA-carboxylase] ligase [Campylobacterota bacterium]